MKIKLTRTQRVPIEAGTTVEVADSVAELLIHAGAAVRVDRKPKTEKAIPAEEAETASKPKKPKKG